MIQTGWSYWNYTPEDYPLVKAWAEAHGTIAVHESWMPEVGFVLCYPDPLILCSLYHDPSCAIAFLDNVHTKPTTPLGILKDGLIFLMTGPLRDLAARRGINTIMTRSPAAMARTMLHTPRWMVNDKELLSMVYYYTEEELYAAL